MIKKLLLKFVKFLGIHKINVPENMQVIIGKQYCLSNMIKEVYGDYGVNRVLISASKVLKQESIRLDQAENVIVQLEKEKDDLLMRYTDLNNAYIRFKLFLKRTKKFNKEQKKIISDKMESFIEKLEKYEEIAKDLPDISNIT